MFIVGNTVRKTYNIAKAGLDLLHASHLGVIKMKALARSYVCGQKSAMI
jgi:hypothetical protein